MTWPLIVTGAAAVMLMFAGGLLTEIGPWYRALRKPPWQPPDWLFGPAWAVILGLAAWSAALGWTEAGTPGRRAVIVGLFAANAVLHFAWSPLFFKLRRPDWALAEMLVLWLSIVALVAALWPVSTTAALFLSPYLVWVSYAVTLNVAIVRLNGPFAPGGAPGRGAPGPSPTGPRP